MAGPNRNRPNPWPSPVPHRRDARLSERQQTAPRPAEPSLLGPAAKASPAAPFNLQQTLEILRDTWGTEREGRRKNRLTQLEAWFRFADHLRANRDDLVQFARQSEFVKFRGARPSVDKPDEVLRHVIRFVFGFGEGAKRRVSRYANALEPAFRSGISPDAIGKHVVASGGINKMASANARTRRVAKPARPLITVKAEAGELAQRVLDLEPGQQAKVGFEILAHTSNTTTVKITSVKQRKSPRETK
jgi:hypothetical protein